MSSNLNSAPLPPPANKVGGKRMPMPYKHPKQDEALVPQTNVETSLGAPQNQDLLQQALGLPIENPNPPIYDQTENPKAIASTYHPPVMKHHENLGKQRSNARGVDQIQQIGGAYGVYRH